MPRTWTTGEKVTAAEFNLLPRVLYRDVLSAGAASVTIADADITGTLADWETIKLTVEGDNSGTAARAIYLQFNGDTAANYSYLRHSVRGDLSERFEFDDAATEMFVGVVLHNTTAQGATQATIAGHSRSDRRTVVNAFGAGLRVAAEDHWMSSATGQWHSLSVVTSLTVLVTSNQIDTDTLIMLEGCMRREPS